MQLFVKLYDVFRQMRWHQWYKGFFTFFALLWLQHQSFSALMLVLTGAVAFSFTSSIVYIINDFSDIDRDRAHATKKLRPLAAGKLNPLEALSLMVLLTGLVMLLIGVLGNVLFAGLLLGYLVLNLFYTYWIKHIPYVDILFVAGFAGMRVVGGFILLGLPIVWYVVGAIVTLTLFVMTVKRLAEISTDNIAARPVIGKYSKPTLKFFMTVFMMLTVILYFVAVSIIALPLVYTDVLYFLLLLTIHEYMSFPDKKKHFDEDGFSYFLHHRLGLVLLVLFVLTLVVLSVLCL